MSQFADPNATSRKMAALHQDAQKMKRRVSAIEATMRLAALNRPPVFPIEFRSQFGEDALLWELFAGQVDGFFIEVGAFDGYDCSVSYAFEAMGWKGLLVEAIPERFEQCRARRPHSRCVHAALSCRGSSGTTTFTVTDDAFGGMLSFMDPHSEHARTAVAKSRREVTVPLTTMDDILKDHQGEIDFAVIDVEGSELMLLDGFNVEKYRPKVLLIEDNTQGRDADLTRYLERSGYQQLGMLEVNRVCIRQDLAHWKSRLF